MTDRGVFSLSRAVWEHDAFDREPYTQCQAWIWILSATAWEERKVGHFSGIVTIHRGEFCYSLRFMASKFQWSKDRVRRFLSHLQRRDMIRAEDRDGYTIYKVLNYDDYQFGARQERDADNDSHASLDETPPATKNKQQESRIKKDISSPKSARTKKLLNGNAQDFEAFYAAYPKHVARAAAEKAYAKALERAAPEQILAGAKRYAVLRAAEDPQYTKMPATWLNQDCWLDELPNSTAGPIVDPEYERIQKLELEARAKREKAEAEHR